MLNIPLIVNLVFLLHLPKTWEFSQWKCLFQRHREGQNYMCPPLFFFSSGKSQWRVLGERIVSLRNEQRLLWWREGGKRLRESTKCCHWRGLRQLNQGDTDFSLSETITSARTAWDFMKCFWTQTPDRRALHNLCFVNAGNRQPTERHSQKQCAQLLV